MNDQDTGREELLAELAVLRQRLADRDGSAVAGRQATPASALADVVKDRQRLADIIEASHAGTWEWNVQTGETIFNQRWAEIVGYSLDELSPTSIQTWERLVHPDDLRASKAMLERHFRGELNYYDLAVRMKHKDGSWVWVRDRGRVSSWTDEGQPLWMLGTHFDVTSQKHVEAALEASEKRHHAYVDQIADALVVHDAAGRFLDVNPQACASLGYSREELLRLKVADVETEINCSEAVWRQSGLGETITWMGRQRRQDGSTFPVEVRVSCFELDGQRYYLALARDVAERNRAEHMLRDAQTRLSLAVEASGIGFWDWDLRTNVVHFSPEWKRQIGYRDEEIADRFEEWQSRMHPDDLEYVLQGIRSYLADPQGKYEVEFRFRHKDGSYRSILTQAAAISGDDGHPSRFLGCHIDITDRKRAEEALRKSEQRLAIAASGTRIGMFDWNVTTNECLWSEQQARLLGHTTAITPTTTTTTTLSLPYKYSDWADRVHPEDLPRVEGELRRCMAEHVPYEAEYRILWPDGSEHWIMGRGVCEYGPQGQPQRMLGVAMDITERKQAEGALKASLREKEVLLKEIHHRVKNNLQVISSMVSLQASEAVDEAVREVLQDVTGRVRSMTLVHEKLYQSADLARVDFAEYAESLLHYLWRAYHTTASGARLSLDLEPVAIPVHAAVPCGLILNELAGNALKHAFPGGREGEVSVSLHADSGGRVCLRVRDNGVGLPAGLDWRSGKSLGLQLVQIVAEQLGADVAVVSHPGTEFAVAFGGTKA